MPSTPSRLWTASHAARSQGSGGRNYIRAIRCPAGITSESLAQPPVQLVVGDADETFREAAAALAPLANVTNVVAPPNAGDSAYVHSALCYAHALELCSHHARCAPLCDACLHDRLAGSSCWRQPCCSVGNCQD